MTVEVKRDLMKKLSAQITELAKYRLMVGIPSDKAGRQEPGELNNAAIGYIQENGSDVVGIPPRPFLYPTMTDKQDLIESQLKKAGEDVLRGGDALPRYHALGLQLQAAVRQKITTGPFHPLAPSTLANRRARGFLGTKPLIVTGQLRNSINYVIRKMT